MCRSIVFRSSVLLAFMLVRALAVHGQVQVFRTSESGQVLHAQLGPQLRVAESQAYEFLARFYALGAKEQLVARSSIEDGEQTHTRYHHTVDGHEVIGSQLIGHFEHGVLTSFNGWLAEVEPQEVQVEFATARSRAIAHIGAERYAWEDSLERQLLRQWTGKTDAEYWPSEKMVYACKDLDPQQAFRLCYAVDIYAVEPLLRKVVYVDALEGTIWAEEELIHVTDVQGTANTRYRGARTITTDSTGPGSYRLQETGRGNGIRTFNMKTGTSYAAAVDFTDSDNYWNNYNAAMDEVATDAHYGAEMTYDYFWNTFSRNSFDGNGAAINSYVHYRSNYANAFWNGYVMTYGDGNGTSFTPLTSIDVCGHEVAHAVTTYSAGLIYRYESGALNESFSDIFGNAIEYYADSSLMNWRIGEDIVVSGNGIRNMADPNTHGDPDTYKGLYWHTSAFDNGGVHTNSGVQNYWFYLLCVGDTGTNDLGDSFAVDSIGIHKAEAIAYRNLTVYLGPNSQYEDARYYAIRSAADLFGPCSDEVVATTNAWYAVGVGPEYDSAEVVADFEADTFYCQGDVPVQFSNRSLNAQAYRWYFGDGDTSSLLHPTHLYGAQGVFDVRLIAEGCHFGLEDTMDRIAYIVIDSTADICNAVFMPAGQWDTVYSCNTFVYDNGGEADYLTRIRDTLTIVYAPSDSALIVFEDFDYETDYDSVYIHDGYDPSAPIIGAFTGTTLPMAGAPIKSTSGAVTLRHFSDPYLVGRGFKLHLQAYRDSIWMTRTADSMLCYQEPIRLEINGRGGYAGDRGYWWNGVEGDSFLNLAPKQDTVIHIKFGDRCLKEFVEDSIVLLVRPALRLDSIQDSLVCYGQEVVFHAASVGGDRSSVAYTWLPMDSIGDSLRFRFTAPTQVSLLIGDGCSPAGDTIGFLVDVRPDISWGTPMDTTLCQGGDLHLALDPQGGLGQYQFLDLGGTVLHTGSSYRDTLATTTTGPQSHALIVSDACTEGPDTVWFDHLILDSLSLTPLNDTVICQGTLAMPHAWVTGGDGSYIYTWSQGLPNVYAPQWAPTASSWVSVRISDGCSAFEPVDSLYVKVLPALQVQLSGPDTACFDQALLLRARASGGDSTDYRFLWNVSALTDSVLPWKPQTSTAVVVRLQDQCSANEAADTLDLHVLAPLQLAVPNDTALCLGDGYTARVQGVGGRPDAYVFSWDQGMGLGPQKQLAPTSATTYTIVLSDGCSHTVSDQLRVDVLSLPAVDLRIETSPSCTGEFLRFSALLPLPGASYEWGFGDGSEGSGSSADHSYSQAGIYDIWLRATDANGCKDSGFLNGAVEIVERPVADFSHDPGTGDLVNAQFRFTNRSAFASNYSWDFGDGAGSLDPDPRHEYQDTGLYRVELKVYNDLGCADTTVRWVLVKDVFRLHIPNAFSPNGDPYNETFRISGRGIVELEVLIFNRWGEILWRSERFGERWDGTVGGARIDPGLYFVQVRGVDFEGNAFADQGELLILN